MTISLDPVLWTEMQIFLSQCEHFDQIKKPVCRNAKELLRVGLHWHVPLIEDLSETVQVVW